MMEDVQRALHAFWSGFRAADGTRLPAYLTGHVPTKINEDDKTVPIDPPYITYEVAVGAFGTSSFLTAISWHRQAMDGSNINLERAQLMDQIAKAIPEAGRRLPLQHGGFLMLYRGDSAWQSTYDDPEDPAVIGGRIAYRVVYYTQ